MAVDAFLKIDGIDGESFDKAHPGSIEVSSYSFGVSNPTTISSATGGAGAGKAQFSGFHFTANSSKASPKLMQACATGQHIKSALLFCRKAGGEQQSSEFLKITLTDVLLSSIQLSGSGGDVPTDQFSLNYAKIEFIWFTPNPDGALGTSVLASWDIKTNAKL